MRGAVLELWKTNIFFRNYIIGVFNILSITVKVVNLSWISHVQKNTSFSYFFHFSIAISFYHQFPMWLNLVSNSRIDNEIA